ncbi:MAG TPA: YdiU family protein [Epulopiscium sp.]|nr:YdiU family protein [Candidatus Epulonipiscium sp.]
MNPKDTGWNLENSYLELPKIFFSEIETNDILKPELVVFNDDLGKLLGLNIKVLKSEEGIKILVGNTPAPGGTPIAQAYAGHQFGNFTMLGDGRAMLIGEQLTPDGKRYDVQLKGSGRTPYSRGGDGLATIGPMLREYIISEAMYGLGIPTTRSLAVVATGEPVLRETELEGAILTRIGSSHIRVGTFQYAANFGNTEDVRALADYTIKRHFPSLKSAENPYLSLLEEVIRLQAALIAKWQLVGFIHGVMNTDNMVICGETIDYGPCAFMDTYDAATVFSSIDRNSRYAYGNQPNIGGWNIARFAETLLPLLGTDPDESIRIAEEAIKTYADLYNGNWLQGMRFKLGILNEEKDDEALIKELLVLMSQYKSDFTNTFIGLTVEDYKRLDKSGLFKSKEFEVWESKWKSRLEKQEGDLEKSKKQMKRHNPKVIPRNHQVEKALEAAIEGDYTVFHDLLEALASPYDYSQVDEMYMKLPESYDSSYRTFCGT